MVPLIVGAVGVTVLIVSAGVTVLIVGAGVTVPAFVDSSGRFLSRIGDAVETTTSNTSKFLTTKVWPRIVPTLRILPAYLLILIISHCDAFLIAGPRTASEALLAKSVYYICWTCTLYFLLKVLLDDILRVKAKENDRIVIAVALALGVLLPSWEIFGDYLIQSCRNLIYYVFWSIIILIILLLAIKYCKPPH